ncbi:Os05g0443400 [Oryza sativa Japonica Group]|uniref:Os05g0443400 protein n=1 Tax=Oryza sativa subsp. japonica TaxID=39947 RepID=A0A0P0WN08_ORYSJ|nr:Os05g0443400 [Oryza sativa Japonica Group]
MRNCSPVTTSRELSLRRAAAKPEAGMELCAVFFSSVFSLLLLLLLSAANDVVVSAATSPPLKFGINYGQIANNLPHPTQVSGLLQSLSVNRVSSTTPTRPSSPPSPAPAWSSSSATRTSTT